MVASRQVQIPFYRVLVTNVNGDSFHLLKLLGELQLYFCVNISSQLQNAYVLTCWNLLRQKLQRLLVVDRISKRLQRLTEDGLCKISWVVVARKGLRIESFQQNLQKNQSVAKRHFYKHFSIIMSSNFRYQPFVAVSGNLGGKVPVIDYVLPSLEQEIYPTISLDENYIEVEFQMDRNYYVDLRQTYLALKLQLVKGHGYET